MSQSAIVIGGGIAGCSTAFALAQRGIAVTLLERNASIASGASGNPVAMLYPKFSAQASLANNLTNLGFHITTALINQFAQKDQFYNACGQLQLAFNAAEQTKQDELYKSDYLHKNQWFMKFLDAAEASEIAGIDLTIGGLFLPNSGWVKPTLFCQALCNSSLINVLINCQALTIKRTQNGWRVTHNNGFLDVENVVICNANDVKEFGFCNSAQIMPVRGQLDFFASNIASKKLKTIICSDHYLSPAIDGMHAIGTTYAPNDLNAEISAADTQSNLNALKKMSLEILQKIDPKTITSRVAFRSQTLDYRPLAGQVLDEDNLRKTSPRYNANPADLPWLRGLYVNAGHGSKGMITAPICGELIANLITKTDLPTDAKLASSMNPSRFLLRELGLKQLAASLYK
jgi:tRNA 5-methylaminomethyl-2-thiouridine biosynthesis bifunctional protein